MATSENSSSLLRLTFLSVVIALMLLALLARLWFLQVLAGDRYVALADTNRLRTVVVEAPRGDIVTADGQVLVRNRPALAISGDRQVLLDAEGRLAGDEARLAIERLAELLEVEVETILDRLTSRRYSPFRPVPIAIDVSPELVFAIREHQELYPGIVAETLPVRDYPHGTLAAHLVGYLNEITEAELADERFSDYRGGDLVGRAGLEAVYEADLRGTAGSRLLEVNAQNRVLGLLREVEPQPGNDLVVSLDLELQRVVEQLLESGIIASRDIVRTDGRNLPSTAGSAIVLDATDSSVLAMASYPTYDPREFVGGLSPDYAHYLYEDPDVPQPMVNRAIAGRYPPGSVFKVVSGAALVEAGLAGINTNVPCPRLLEVGGNTFRNWNPVNEPAMNLATALARSCDTYFYELAYQQWLREDRQLRDADGALTVSEVDEAVQDMSARFGLGMRLGIDLPGEAAGYIPGRASKHERWLQRRESWCRQAEAYDEGSYVRAVLEDNCLYGHLWRGGDAINMSIGQGEVETTPLQIAAAYVAVANGGDVLRPRLGMEVRSPSGELVREITTEVASTLDVDDAILAAMRSGLERVVMTQAGTASGVFAGFPLGQITVAGKTGTAEQRPKVPYAWFVAYAPADDPQYVVVVSVEEGGGGAQTAAPIARNILEHLFDVAPPEGPAFQAGPEILD